jgi:hypothetical protein
MKSLNYQIKEPPSEILAKFLTLDPNQKTSIENIVSQFKEYGFVLTLIFFALPAIIPLPPGFTFVVAIPLIILTYQIIIGYEKVLLPQKLNQLSLKNSTLIFIANKSIPILSKIESFLKPRFNMVTEIFTNRVIGIISFCCSIAVMNPLPFTHSFPAFAIIIMSLGSLRKDGIVIIVGVIVAIIGFIISFISLATLLIAVKAIFSHL